MVLNLSKFNGMKCTQCIGDLTLKRKNTVNFAYCENCGKVWMLDCSKDGNIVRFECYELSFLIEFNVELPFNLGLPTGIYSYITPNQIMVRRDMYYFQKGNELENVRTMQPFYYPERETFDDFGMVRKDHKDKGFKRKMKTVLFKRFPISGTFRKGVEIEKFLNEPNMLGLIFRIQNAFLELVNQFLMYYSIFFPANDIKGLPQHEIRPISIYEFSKCLFNCRAIINNKPYEITPIIQDYTNLKGYPDFSYLNEKGKLDEFEKILQNRNNISILEYQQMFILARSLYRTNRSFMGATVITVAMTAYEALLYSLERNHPHFQKLKNVRKNIFKKHPNLKKPGKKSFGFLEFYTNYARSSIFWLIKRDYRNNFENSKELREHLKNLNMMRWIRNDIVHRAEFKKTIQKDYNTETGFKDIYLINYKDKRTNKSYSIDFSILWQSYLKIYDVLNKMMLKIKYNIINWEIDCIPKFENLGFNTEQGRHILSMVPNINWREMNSYRITMDSPSVPPELFPIDLKTNDDKKFSINLSKETERFERFTPIEILINSSSKDIKKLMKQKNGYIHFIRGSPKIYSSCENCGYILAIHQHHHYKNYKCPKCKTEFDILDKWLNCGIDYLKSQNFKIAIEFFKKALEINPEHHDVLNNIGVCYFSLKNYEQSRTYFEKIDLNSVKDSKRKITFICHKAMTYYELNQKDRCKELFNKASLLDPENFFLLINQCIYLTNEKHSDDALILCESLIEKDESNPELLYLKSRLLTQKRKYSEAIAFLSNAINLDPSLKNKAMEQEDFEPLKDLNDFKSILNEVLNT